VAGGDAEQGTEGGVPGAAAVEAEDELVEIGLQVLATQAVINAQGPDFEIGEDAVRPGQNDVGGHFTDDMELVIDAGGAGISRPSVGLGGGAGGEIGFEEGMQAGSRVIGHLTEPDAAGAGPAVLDLDRADDEDFALMAAAATAVTVLLRQTISVSSTSTRPASALRPGAIMLRRSLAAISQADLYEPKPSWRCSCRAEMPLEWVAIR
jgi:hypothetical protein